MTSFIAWIGVDHRAPSSLYFASDSRISWSPKQGGWDCGRKLFACKNRPDLFGYVGDVLFPSLVLGQLTQSIDLGGIFSTHDGPSERFGAIKKYIQLSFSYLPPHARQPFSIVYATREHEGMDAKFFLWKLDWSGSAWTEDVIDIPLVSSALKILGSGSSEIMKWQHRWHSSKQGGTSRAIFSGFYDSVKSGGDIKSGGAIQLIGLYRIQPARSIGIIDNGEPYLLGMKLSSLEIPPDIEWRNSKFERCDCFGNLIESAQKHLVPKGLGKF